MGRPATVAPDAPTADERKFLLLVNEERRARGIAPLAYNAGLRDVARTHSREMAAKRYFAHESPTPGLRTPMDRYLRSLSRQPQYLLVGENLFYSSATGVERGHKALMDSPGHRRNLLDPRYDAIGVGTYVNADGEYWVTQMFMKRRD